MDNEEKKDYFSPNINESSRKEEFGNSCNTGTNAGVCFSGNRPTDCSAGSGADF